jgi:hypothetical protein
VYSYVTTTWRALFYQWQVATVKREEVAMALPVAVVVEVIVAIQAAVQAAVE